MKDTIYLTVDKTGVKTMRKGYTGTRRGEVCVKLNIEIPDNAFEPPILEQNVIVCDWRKGIDLEDVEFNQGIITEEEAAIVREKRLEKMRMILESQGFEVSEKQEE